MKKLFITVLFFYAVSINFAQNKYADSLKNILIKTTQPIERFKLFVKLGEDNFISGNGNVDSFTFIQLHQIA